MLLLRWGNALHDTQRTKTKALRPTGGGDLHFQTVYNGENASPTIRFMLQGWAKCFLHPGMRHSIMDVQSNHTVATSC